jgi:hypothetical protein
MAESSLQYENPLDLQANLTAKEVAVEEKSASAPLPGVYTKPVLKIGSENPSGKLGGNACCGHC